MATVKEKARYDLKLLSNRLLALDDKEVKKEMKRIYTCLFGKAEKITDEDNSDETSESQPGEKDEGSGEKSLIDKAKDLFKK